jgi:1,4-alpha-glucan branching enzyme
MIKTTKKPKTTSTKSTPNKPGPSTRAAGSAAKTAISAVSAAKPTAVSAKPKTNGPSHVCLELVKPGAKMVCVAGSFNEWKPEQTPLVPQGNGRWVGDLAVKPGRHEYLFVVDGQWVPDPNAKETVANPFGGQNSVLIVSE